MTVHFHFRCAPLLFAIFGVAAAGLAATARSNQEAFANENDAAMTRMMAGMDVKPSGDVDRDFAAMMIPHQQAAIDMAKA
jgi:uncharacterized protein (DUF305 family)